MLGDYSIVDIATVIGVGATFVGMVASIITIIRDNKSLREKVGYISEENKNLKTQLSQEHGGLSKEHSDLSKEHRDLSKEHASIKKDTDYIVDTLKYEKRAREALYNQTDQAQEILRTMDMMKEVVVKNYELNQKVSELTKENKILLEEDREEASQLLSVLNDINRKLSDFENYRETQEIQSILKSIMHGLRRFED